VTPYFRSSDSDHSRRNGYEATDANHQPPLNAPMLEKFFPLRSLLIGGNLCAAHQVHDDKRRAIRVRNHRRGFDRLFVNDLQEIVVDLVQAGDLRRLDLRVASCQAD